MKRKLKVNPPIKTTDRERLENLISLAIDRYKIEDIVFCFLDSITSWQDRDKVVIELLKDKDLKDDLITSFENDFKKGKIVVEVQTMEQENKLTDFINTHIYPYYNQQQSYLFA